MPTLYNQYIYRDGAWRQTGTSSDSVTYQLSLSEDTLTLTGSDGSTSSVSISGGGNSEIFIAHYNETTYTELVDAYNEGKALFAKFNERIYVLNAYDAAYSVFAFLSPTIGVDALDVTCTGTYGGNDTSWANFTYEGSLGNINSYGDIDTSRTNPATIASGDRLVINDESASKLNNSSITFGTNSTQYLANNGTWQNIPTAPVTSVNSKTGAVNLTASDVGALPDTTEIPSKTSDLTNDSGFITGYSASLPISIDEDDIQFKFSDGTNLHKITDIEKGTIDGISGLIITYDSESIFFLPDGVGFNTGSQRIISQIPTSTSDLTNDSNFVSDANYVHTDNNFTDTLEAKLNGIAEGATVDDHKWNDVSLSKTHSATSVDEVYIPYLSSTTSTSSKLMRGSVNPQSWSLAKFNDSAMLKSATPTAGDSSTKVATTAFVSDAIGTAISGVNSFEYEVVQALPTTNIKDHTIYLVAKTGSTGDVYDEYLYINNAWEHIGSTDVDLSGYVPTTRKVNNKALSSDITLTASDVGALPDSTVIPAQTAKIWTGTCTTYESTEKIVTLDDSTGFSLTDKTMIAVTFYYYHGGGTAITLNVNNTGAKDVRTSSTTQINSFYGQSTIPRWGNYDIVLFSYHKQIDSWVFCGSYVLEKEAYDLASNAVPKTRTVNGKALSSNITLTASDVNAQPTITASGILKGNGSGTISSAIAGTDYQEPLPDYSGEYGKSLISKDSSIEWDYPNSLYSLGEDSEAWIEASDSEGFGSLVYRNRTTDERASIQYGAHGGNNYDKTYIDLSAQTINLYGSIDANNHQINNVSNPTANTDAANKQYVDNSITTKQDKYTITTATISASGWSNSVYSALQTTYPAASYDIEIELNGDLVTTEQKDAWDGAQIVGSATGNIIKALGDVPAVDIPVIVKATPTTDTSTI